MNSFVNTGLNVVTKYNRQQITMLGKFSCKVFVKVSDNLRKKVMAKCFIFI